jgi:peptide/nickel transport system ATP-binding protein/oligopeptide transport system ATP-binding protein
MSPLLEARNLVKDYPSRDGKEPVRAVDGVSLTLAKGATLGIVGESGGGKSTLARLILRLLEPTTGEVYFEGENLLTLRGADLRRRRRDLQIVFQDPYASLDPRMAVEAIIAEPLAIHRVGSRAERRERVMNLLSLVGLDPSAARRYPHEFSGGQRQRIGIARAIALDPKLVVLDEPVSALDVSIQSQVLNLLVDLKGRLGLSYIFISHDLSVVEHMSDEIAVMYLGRIVERGPADRVFTEPRHPYTRALVSAVLDPDPLKRRQRIVLKGDQMTRDGLPPGCRFHPRCAHAMEICREAQPAVTRVEERSEVECFLYELPESALNSSQR